MKEAEATIREHGCPHEATYTAVAIPRENRAACGLDPAIPRAYERESA